MPKQKIYYNTEKNVNKNHIYHKSSLENTLSKMPKYYSSPSVSYSKLEKASRKEENKLKTEMKNHEQ